MASSGAQNVKVTIYSDLACPWCYIGQRRLDKALEAMPGVQADKEWHAYLLDWNAPVEGEPIEDALARKFGSSVGPLMKRVTDAGRSDGAPFADWKWRANTVRGHVLVALARKHGKSHEANAALFAKSYEEGGNISEPAALLEVGRSLGLPEAELQEALGDGEVSQELLAEVKRDDGTAKTQLHVTGVPFFLISAGDSQKIALSGAQPPEAFQEAVQLALKQAGSSGGAAAAGTACGPGTGCA